MSNPHKYHRRHKAVLKAKLAQGNIKEFLEGPAKKTGGAFGYCPALVDLQELRFQESERQMLGHKVDSSTFDRYARVYLLKGFRKQGMDNFSARLRLIETNRESVEYNIREYLGREEVPYFERLELIRPFAIALLNMQLGLPKKGAEDLYDLFVDREMYGRGLIDRNGFPTDEAQELAILATYQFATNQIFGKQGEVFG